MTPADAGASVLRLEVFTRRGYRDGRAVRTLESLRKAFSAGVGGCAIVDVFLLQGIPACAPDIASEVFCDQVAQELLCNGHAADRAFAVGASSDRAFADGWDFMVEVSAKPGVTDPVALTAREALGVCLPAGVPAEARIQTAVQCLVAVDPGASLDTDELARFFYNPLIQNAVCITRAQWADGARPPSHYAHEVRVSPGSAAVIDLAGLSDSQLAALSRERLLALSGDEMKAVQGYFGDEAVRAARSARGLPAGATDVELEMIAQTWSEHCNEGGLREERRIPPVSPSGT